jgi:hypothetical protein
MEIDAPVKIFVDRRKCRTDFASFEPFDCRAILASVPSGNVRFSGVSWRITGLCAGAFSIPAIPLTDHRQFDILQSGSGWWETECSSIT